MMKTYKPFRAFSEYEPMKVYERHLPHWQQEGCSYFVTFRLADSIPQAVIKKWYVERDHFFARWKLVGDVSAAEYKRCYLAIPEEIRRTFERDQLAKPLRELDKCHGCCALRKQELAEVVKKALLYFDCTRLQCGDFVVMPNHVHWIVMPLVGFDLVGLLKSVKQYSSRQMGLKSESLKGRVWQAETYDRCIRDREELERTRNYINANPRVARLNDGDCLYYRAGWL